MSRTPHGPAGSGQDPMAELRGILEVMPAPARSLVPGGEAEYRGQAHVLTVTAVWPDGI